MIVFTRHPQAQGLTYAAHWRFAMGIAWRLFRSVIAFAVHATLPFIAIEARLDLEASASYLLERNRHIVTAVVSAGGPRRGNVRAPLPKGALPGLLETPASTRTAAFLLFLWDVLDALAGLIAFA